MNDAWHKPIAADLKFPAWPPAQPIVLPAKPMRPKGSKKKRKADWLDQDSSQYEVDLADVDITQLGKMLNPEQNIAKLKRADSDGSDAVRDEKGRPLAESNMAGLIKSKHRMTAQEVIKSFDDTLEVQGRVKKNAKKII